MDDEVMEFSSTDGCLSLLQKHPYTLNSMDCRTNPQHSPFYILSNNATLATRNHQEGIVSLVQKNVTF